MPRGPLGTPAVGVSWMGWLWRGGGTYDEENWDAEHSCHGGRREEGGGGEEGWRTTRNGMREVEEKEQGKCVQGFIG